MKSNQLSKWNVVVLVFENLFLNSSAVVMATVVNEKNRYFAPNIAATLHEILIVGTVWYKSLRVFNNIASLFPDEVTWEEHSTVIKEMRR